MSSLSSQTAAAVKSAVAAWLLGWGWWRDRAEAARRYKVLTNPLLSEYEAHHVLSVWREQGKRDDAQPV